MHRSNFAVQLSVYVSGNASPRQLQASSSIYICKNPVTQLIHLSSSPLNALYYLDISHDEATIRNLTPEEAVDAPQMQYRLGDRNTPSAIPLSENSKLILGSTSLKCVQILRKGDQLLKESNYSDSVCRVCYEQGSAQHPLLAVCRCIGDTKYIHRECLGTWIQSKMIISPGAKVVYLPKAAFMCEICHASYFESANFSIASVLRKFFDSEAWGLFELQPQNNRPLFVLIKLNLDGVIIGRSETADLRLSDKSVSRKHARLVYQQHEIFVEDASSRTGTWLSMEGEVSLVQHRCIVLKFADLNLEVKLQRVQRSLHMNEM